MQQKVLPNTIVISTKVKHFKCHIEIFTLSGQLYPFESHSLLHQC